MTVKKIDELAELLNNDYIIIESFREHSKASEKYIDVTFIQPNGYLWKGSIPYFYRRTGLFIETLEDLSDYLNKIYPLFSKKAIDEFVLTEKKRWNDEMNGKETTKGFFDKLLNLNWNSVQFDLPSNRNFARRIQDIKEFGYTIATDTRRKIKDTKETDTHLQLVPLPKGGITGYEIMSPTFKSRVVEIMESINVYELSAANKHGLLPDHKFPEIRWDAETKVKNLDDMNEIQIKEKFQLIDNQRNQQKREACRKCFQTGKRGKLYGLNYYYQGDENWSDKFPKIGKESEKGCVGCGWYDIQKWRVSLNELFNKKEIKMKYTIIPNETKIGIVKAVHDGDSIKIQFEDGEVSWVRLYGCDAPEVISNHVGANQPYGKEAGDYLRKLIKGQKVKVQTLFRDQFNRMICKVDLINEADRTNFLDLTLRLISNGMAWWLDEPKMQPELRAELKSLHAYAKGEMLGLWGQSGRKLRPSTWRSRNRRFLMEKEFEELW